MTATVWLVVGFLGQALFTSRFLVQWIASERLKKSVVPTAFWWFSIGGGVLLLAYAIYRQDPVFSLGQGMGLIVYLRNLMLISRETRHKSDAESPSVASSDLGSPKTAAEAAL
ncbi:lipid-A-disaccharide synthase N-terminal domain-containing protein [Paracoccus aminophilus]|uniref:Lipid A biosynthesis domain-containing protein n=1 Tax=Paracoccus aminophilus JCM 7686 TaxID=1367847 RepID=S5XS62_PARAH|nr:lipid-A-disaccharide synthase N-terminal domain-containing protein [Paracoccus aminophilus]AGT10294.1 lipid A biosynthesis domain-containing protein [Paracoccus aminophilus JCM 7686]